MLKYKIIPILNDNYVFIIYDERLSIAAVIDPGTSAEVIQFLNENNLELTMILITHYHHDHIGGVRELVSMFSDCKVYSSALNREKLDNSSLSVIEGDIIPFSDVHISVIELPGHTLDHIAFYLKDYGWLFSGDVLFGLGCGRIFEGTMDEAFQSLQKIKAYSPDTLVFCTHEYTKLNLEFCHSCFPSAELDELSLTLSALIKEKTSTVPLILKNELRVNPFLTTDSVQEFTRRRQLRNQW